MPSYKPVVKKARKAKSPCYPQELKTIGDHIRKRRLELKLFQKDVAELIQTDTDTVTNWEKNRCQPGFIYYPAIMDFLGYCPWEPIQAWGERLHRYRIHKGLALEQFAGQLGVDPGTLVRRSKAGPSAYLKKKLAELMKSWNSSEHSSCLKQT